MSRIRQIKPSFFTDPVVSRLSAGARLFYIGTWTVADDAGFFEWEQAELGALLYPYEAVARREKDIEKWGRELASAGRLKLFDCGHACIPTLHLHQRLSGPTKQVLMHAKRHEEGDCPRASR